MHLILIFHILFGDIIFSLFKPCGVFCPCKPDEFVMLGVWIIALKYCRYIFLKTEIPVVFI